MCRENVLVLSLMCEQRSSVVGNVFLVMYGELCVKEVKEPWLCAMHSFKVLSWVCRC